MFEKIKSIVLKTLGISSFESKDGKVVFSDEQTEKLRKEFAPFGDNFVENFTEALNKELSDNSAREQADSMKKMMEDMQAKNLEEMKKLQAKIEDQAKKIEILSKKPEDDLEPPKGNEIPSGKKGDFKINMSYKHNKTADAFLNAEMGQDVIAGETIDVTELQSEFGTYISQNDKPILRRLTQPTMSMKFMTTIAAIEQWQATQAIITSVVQQFVDEWTPRGQASFTPITIINRRHKINVKIKPNDITETWLGHLYDESLTPMEMPITKFIINNLIIPQVDDDRENLLIATGEYEALPGGIEEGDEGQETGKSMDGFITTLVKLYEDKDNHNVNFIALGPVTSSNIVDKMEQFVDAIDKLYKKKTENVFVSDQRYKTYKRNYRDLFPNSKNDDKNNDKIDFSKQRLETLDSMDGINHFFTTPKQNFIRLRHKNNGTSKIWLQPYNYYVKVFAEWYEGVGFAMEEAIFAYIDALQVIQGYATNSDASNLKAYMLTDAGCTDVDEGNLADYKVAIAAEASIADLAALQTIIDTVNGA